MSAIVPRTLSTSEAATYVGCERKKLLRLLHAKRIKAKDLGRPTSLYGGVAR